MPTEGVFFDLTIDSEPEHTLCFSEFARSRGYDPKTRTYTDAPAPDTSGRRLHQLNL